MTMIDFIFIVIIILFLLVLITPIILLIIGIRKRNKKIIKLGILAITLIMLFVVLKYFVFPTKFPYADKWIIGKSKEQIIRIYGEPDRYNTEHMIAYFSEKDNGVFGTGLMNSNNEYYYYIFFDKNGLAYKVEYNIQIGG